ncbi:MAG: DUF1844 domain-containing protein [Planctomycetes bacterium]|nr:DUF1844 domain-containing protein [Planctomycetota bacterium]
MSDDPSPVRIHIDSDWKEEAQREKERLRAEEAKAAQTARTAPAAEPGFLELVNLLAMQAAAGLGAMAGPGGERMPPDSRLAQHFIDMLDVLAKKTAGNLTDEEKKTLDPVLHDLRMQYVQTFGGSPAPPAAADPAPKPE